MYKSTNSNSNVNVSKIVGIQFSMLSPEEILKGSVAEITSRYTYINNKPVIGGLFDPRMGVLEPGLICPTDGLECINTPGYHGHIVLARPVFYIQYLATILKVMRCICFKCSKLLISKEKYAHVLNMPEEARWKFVFDLAKKIKRCGEDTNDGCGCLQPFKIKKEGLATITAEWKGVLKETPPAPISLHAELILKIFKRITDEDVSFMGFNPIWSRPDWMICQIMYVPPPSVRPSVKHDAQQRSEDDLSHILVNIIKTNNTLQSKIQNNADANVIDDWTMVLQYYVAVQIDNNIPNVASVAQRSGRPLKSIKDRLVGKSGRMRENLMAKRVDFSARSVITADPNISIRELGIPLKIAKNITRPCVVNKNNKSYLLALVNNGSDKYPGANNLEKSNGETISLRYVDRKSIILEEGDIVHRHMMDGDVILFNRQPTLHRMSMMAHIAKIMFKGDTFRMNVADTKSYNADFDGDEMNLHMPQDVESESELRNLAAVQYQFISPANNSPIIGIYQDSMLGCFQFTRKNIKFNPRDAMNLLMLFKNVDEQKLLDQIQDNSNNKMGKMLTSFDLLTQITPVLSLKYKTKSYKETDNYETSNNVLEINNGKFIRGQIDKGVMGAGTKGILHRLCNDFGNSAVSNFVDDLQNIITEYMKLSSFSVGISDLIISEKTTNEIVDIVTKKKIEIKDLIDQVQLGLFENNSGKTNSAEFETKITNILNQTTAESGKTGLKNLNAEKNGFVSMVVAGSKGSELNISFMLACLGQQNVDSSRIPYGFENRTLPHYNKFDDSPGARGFVESSYINGLSPQELFFHAMGGRVGLIDTAVKTSITGYIQRRLIKGMEDLMVNYDMTVRTNKNVIVQFKYGDDNIDTTKVENQILPIVNMSVQDIYEHYNVIDNKNTILINKNNIDETQNKCKKYTDMMIQMQSEIIEKVFKFKDDNIVNLPVAFLYIINNIQTQCNITATTVNDISLIETFQLIEKYYENIEKIYYSPPTLLFKTLYYYYLSPKDLVIVKKFNRDAIILLLETIVLQYKRAIVAPGEMVGIISGQSIGEISTQMTLNTFHFAGVASKSNVTRGVPRLEEILLLTPEPKNPSLTVYLPKEDETQKDKARSVMHMLEHTMLKDIVESIELCFDPDDLSTLIEEDKNTISQYKKFSNMINNCNQENNDSPGNNDTQSKWIFRIAMDPESMLEKNITMDDIHFTLNTIYDNQISCIYTDFNEDKLVFRIRINDIINKKKESPMPLDQTDKIYLLKNFQDQLLNNVVLRGVKNINNVILRKVKNVLNETNGSFQKTDIWVLDTDGTNLLDVLALDYIDNKRTVSNDIIETFNVLGIEAARQTIFNELVEVIEFDGTYVNYHNFSILVDRMTYESKMISIFRYGINSDNIGPIAKASFEETPEMFLKAARHAELDMLRGVSANIMCGQEGYYGTSSFQVMLDIDNMTKLNEKSTYNPINVEKEIDDMFNITETSKDNCNLNKILIQNNVENIKFKSTTNEETEQQDDDYDPGF